MSDSRKIKNVSIHKREEITDRKVFFTFGALMTSDHAERVSTFER